MKVDYEAGSLTRGESIAAIAALVTRENVADIMSELPADFAAELARWASENSAGAKVVVGANLSASEASGVARSQEVARGAIRQWLAREAFSAQA